MRIILLIAFISILDNSNAQIASKEFTPSEKQNLQTLLKLAEHFKKNKTVEISFHETEIYSSEETFYDKVINDFFEKEKMMKAFEKDTSVLAVSGKMDLIRHILNGCDKFLDETPSDSIFVEPFRYSLKTSKTDDSEDALLILIYDNNEMSKVLKFDFDKSTHKLIGLALVGRPRTFN
jgi:hypothetical protein